jgi:uncharacterized membrane protein
MYEIPGIRNLPMSARILLASMVIAAIAAAIAFALTGSLVPAAEVFVVGTVTAAVLLALFHQQD